jgi:hypothetical protein
MTLARVVLILIVCIIAINHNHLLHLYVQLSPLLVVAIILYLITAMMMVHHW